MEEVNISERLSEDNRVILTITSEKFKTKFIVSKRNDGFALFKVATEEGVLPKALSGSYTKLGLAKEDVLKYIKNSKPTKSVVRDKKYEKNHGSASSTKNN